MITLRDVTKRYPKPHATNGAKTPVRALDACSLHIAHGEFAVVRGPSGCGKSTLLLVAGGMLRPESGTVTVDGEDLYAMPPARRARFRAERIGFVFQLFHLLPYLSARDNIAAASTAGLAAGRRIATDLLDRFGLADRAAHTPGALSAGERQRVAVARAIVNAPRVLLADEPTGSLDPESAEAVLAAIAEFNQSGGTVLLVTHDPPQANPGRRDLRMNRGALEPALDPNSAPATVVTPHPAHAPTH